MTFALAKIRCSDLLRLFVSRDAISRVTSVPGGSGATTRRVSWLGQNFSHKLLYLPQLQERWGSGETRR
jgi:hypothetical protein